MTSPLDSPGPIRKRAPARQATPAVPQESYTELVSVLNRAVGELRIARDLEQGYEKGKRLRDWLTLITVAIAAALFVQEWFSVKEQQNIMQRQMDQMQAELRPWISADLAVNGSLVFDGAHATITVKTTMENTGNTPANNVSFQPQLVSQTRSRPFNAADILDNHCPTPTWRTDMAYGDTLFKDQSVDRTISAVADKTTLGAHEGDSLILVNCVYYQLPGGAIKETASFYLLGGAVWRDHRETIPRENLVLYPQGGFAK